jgi:hypothetical protein
MRNIIYSFFLLLFLTTSAKAQIKLMGMAYNMGTNSMNVVQWTLFDASSVTYTPTSLNNYLFASSSFDPFNGTYYISGSSGPVFGLFSFNTDTGEGNLATGALYSNIAEFDMSNSKMYNLFMETEGYIDVYEYDIVANEDSLIGTIPVPGVNGIVTDAIGFDSNNGIIYYVGFTNENALALYSIPVRDETFSYSVTLLNTSASAGSITSLNFDNVNEKLFAVNDVVDQNGNSGGRSIIEIDITTGDVSTLAQLTEFPYFLGGSSQFDQNTGTFLLVGINTNNETQMIAFDTNTNTYQTGFVPAVSEIVCDNKAFARNRYMQVGLGAELSFNFNVYPNPVSSDLNAEFTANGPVQIEIYSSVGELVYNAQGITSARWSLDVSQFSAGVYTMSVKGEHQSMTKKLVVE